MILSILLSLWTTWAATQNAVLFSAEDVAEKRIAGQDVAQECVLWREWVERTRVGPGLFERRPGYGDINSHDNYLGMALGAWACDFPSLTIEITNELAQRGWAFNDVPPFGYDIRGQLTPKDIVPLKLVAGWDVSPFEAAYASLDLCIGKSWNLKRARVLIYENTVQSGLVSIILAPCIWRAKRMVDYVQAGCNYHGEASPQCVALRQTKGAWK
jgi:hypothetical protein